MQGHNKADEILGGAPKLSQGVGLSAHTPAQGPAAMASPGYPLQSLTRCVTCCFFRV